MDYEELVRQKAKELGSDGCTGVSELYHVCCLEHDIMYRTGKSAGGTPVNREEADRHFRACMQRKSKLGFADPVSWIRWVGVRWFGKRSWRGQA